MNTENTIADEGIKTNKNNDKALVEEPEHEVYQASIMQKLNAVMKQVRRVKKDAIIRYGRTEYTAVSYDGMIGKIRESFVENGLAILPDIEACKTTPTIRPNSDGVEMFYGYRTEMTVLVNIMDVDTERSISVRVMSVADDHGDKGPGKAYTYAVKMALLKLLMLETGDEEERRIETAATFQKINTDQAQYLRDLCEKTDTPEEKIIENLSKKLKMVFDKLEDVPVTEFNYIERKLKAKLPDDDYL